MIISKDWTDQTFYPIAGSDEIDGGDGYDTVVINESFDDVIVSTHTQTIVSI